VGARLRHRAPADARLLAPAALALYAAVLLWIALGLHTTPLFGVETDLLGDAIPAARALVRGEAIADHFQFKGPGYPLLLAAATPLAGGDEWLAARLVNVAAAVTGAASVFLLARLFLGLMGSGFVVLALVLNSVYLQAAIEAGTDLPAFALSIASTLLLLGRRSARGLAAAGLLAGLAAITRYSALFLPVAAGAVLLARPRRLRALGAYAAGLALPLGGWFVASWMLAGEPLANRNYLNLAYTFYGQGQTWESFWTSAAGRFHSIADVLAYDPAVVLKALLAGLGGHWLLDLGQLVGLGLGVAGLLGLALALPARAGWWGLVLHGAVAYASLAVIFYGPRFFLYLIPFYALGTGALLFEAHRGWVFSRVKVLPVWRRLAAGAGGLAAAVLLASSAERTVSEARSLLDNPPVEVRIAGDILRAHGAASGKVMARKPHVAYFAGLGYVPLPAVGTLTELLQAARATGATHLYYSGLEFKFRHPLRFLIETTQGVPGLEHLATREIDEDSYFALFRFTGEIPPPEVTERAYREAHERYARRHPEDVEASGILSDMLIADGRHREALAFLEQALAARPMAFKLLNAKAYAHFALREFEAAESACRAALAVNPSSAWAHGFLGETLLRLGRPAEAEASVRRAVVLEPTRTSYVFVLGEALAALGRWREAAEQYLRVLRLDPEFPGAREAAALALAQAGERERALALLEPAGADPMLRRLADSLRAAP
jgi:tetratricopeptide (TPR) repeat protein